jgi:alanine-glyoxylate transaminase/serine-glyoxylate transaminase/serine-pyruvate transaminase
MREDWDKVIPKEALEEGLKQTRAKVVALVHAETSTGVLQPLPEISKNSQRLRSTFPR